MTCAVAAPMPRLIPHIATTSRGLIFMRLSAKSCDNSLYDSGHHRILKKALGCLLERFKCRNDDRKRGAAVPGMTAAADTNLPAVSLHDFRCDPKTQTSASLAFGRDKRLEDRGQHFAWNAHACVSDGQADQIAALVWMPVLGNANPQSATRAHGVDRVSHEIGDHLPQLPWAGKNSG